MKTLIFSALLIGLVFIQSCSDQYDFSTDKLSSEISLNTELAIPLVNSEISLDEFLKQNDSTNFLLIDENNFMSLYYEFVIKDIGAPEFFDILDYDPILDEYSGTLDNISYDIPKQEYDLGMERLASSGQFYVKNPSILIEIKNYWNIPASITFTDFNYYTTDHPEGLPVTGTFISEAHTVNPPVSPDLFAITTLEMNAGNSNLDEMISALPNRIDFGGIIETIPGGTYKVSAQSVDSVMLRMTIPLELRITDLVLMDTVEFSLGEGLDSDTAKLESLKINLVASNGFPVDLNAQIYFADEAFNLLGSISDDPIQINSAAVSAGDVTSPTVTTQVITIEGDKKKAILDAKNLIMSFTFNSANNDLNETVKFYSNYRIGIKIGALAKLKL